MRSPEADTTHFKSGADTCLWLLPRQEATAVSFTSLLTAGTGTNSAVARTGRGIIAHSRESGAKSMASWLGSCFAGPRQDEGLAEGQGRSSLASGARNYLGRLHFRVRQKQREAILLAGL